MYSKLLLATVKKFIPLRAESAIVIPPSPQKKSLLVTKSSQKRGYHVPPTPENVKNSCSNISKNLRQLLLLPYVTVRPREIFPPAAGFLPFYNYIASFLLLPLWRARTRSKGAGRGGGGKIKTIATNTRKRREPGRKRERVRYAELFLGTFPFCGNGRDIGQIFIFTRKSWARSWENA